MTGEMEEERKEDKRTKCRAGKGQKLVGHTKKDGKEGERRGKIKKQEKRGRKNKKIE